jgi:CRP-like cAMP-binding protein
MDIFKGLPAKRMETLRRSSEFRTLAPGEEIFRENDPAYGLFTIVKGEVEIFRRNDLGEVVLARVGPNEVFGEMGLLRDTGTRTACARAATEAILFEVGGNPVKLLQSLGDHDSGITFLQNLICILAERMRGKDRPRPTIVEGAHQGVLGGALEGELVGSRSSTQDALARIEKNLPGGFLRKYLADRDLESGEYLCVQGDEPDGFYFIREGMVEVLKGEKGREQRLLANIHAPAVAGDVGFFVGELRSASLRARTRVHYTLFSAKDYAKLRKGDPAKAFELLFAVAQLTVYQIIERESNPRG